MIIIKYIEDNVSIENSDSTQVYNECKSNLQTVVDYLAKKLYVRNMQNIILICNLIDLVDENLVPIVLINDTTLQLQTKLKTSEYFKI